ncbi:DUF1573 domain-containing protein [bacterium]|nr:DUF1573 domain-containing protein [bacterium]
MKNARVSVVRTGAALALATCLCLLATTPPAAAQGQPRIVVEPMSLDFGKMEQFQAETASLVIRNEGDGTLHLGEIEVTCGCTAASPAVKTLAPGASTEVTITFNSENFQGEQIKYIKVNSNDPFHGIVDVAIRSDVRAALAITPPDEILIFRRRPTGERLTKTFTVSTEDVAELSFAPVRYRAELFEVTVSNAASGDPREKFVEIALRADAPLGSFREIVSFESNVPIRPTVNFEVGGEVVAPVVLDPASENLRYLKRNETASRIFKVKVQQGYHIKVTKAEIDLPGFKVTGIDPHPELNYFEVKIEGSPLPISDERAVSAKGRMKGTLRVFTDHPDYPELSASVMYLLKL